MLFAGHRLVLDWDPLWNFIHWRRGNCRDLILCCLEVTIAQYLEHHKVHACVFVHAKFNTMKHFMCLLLCTLGTSSVPQYIHSPVGLFPTPLGPSTRFSVVEDVCAKFRFLGKLMAKSIVDSRMV